MRLQAMRRPDPLHAAMADPRRLGHCPATPVRRLARRAIEGHRHDPLDHCRGQGRLAAGAGGIPQQAVHARLHEASLPAPDRRLGFAGAALDLRRADPVGAQQHDARPPDMLLRAVPGRDNSLKPLALFWGKVDLDASSHPCSFAPTGNKRNLLLAPVH